MTRSTTLHWRQMTEQDILAVSALASDIHADLPESDAVLLEKLALFPLGCSVLSDGFSVMGYLISHPWLSRDVPALDQQLGALPVEPDTYYIHDLALAVEGRGQGMASEIIQVVLALARSLNLASISLVAVGGSAKFWEHHHFNTMTNAELGAKLATYEQSARYMVRSESL